MLKKFTIFGSGFVGKNLCLFLEKRGYRVFMPSKQNFKFKNNLNHVIYCIGNQNWLDNLQTTYEANLGMLAKILFNNRFKSFTLISSTRLYLANKQNETNENNFIKVDTSRSNFFYNSLKITAENLCLSINKKNIKVVRFSNLYANKFTKQKYILPSLIRDATLKKKITLKIGKNSTKDFIHVEDAFNILLKIIIKSKHRMYNIANGKNYKISEIVKKIKELTNCKILLKQNIKTIKEPKININRIKKEFRYKTKYNLLDIIDKMIDKKKTK